MPFISESVTFYPEKQTVTAHVCEPVTMSLRTSIDLRETSIRVEKFIPLDNDYYYLFYKRNGNNRLRESKKTGSLGHYPRLKPTIDGNLFTFSISRVIEEDEGMYVVSLKVPPSESWENSYITLLIKDDGIYYAYHYSCYLISAAYIADNLLTIYKVDIIFLCHSL